MVLFGKGKHLFPAIDNQVKQNFIFYGSPEVKELEQKLSVQFFETFGHTHCSISLLYNKALFCGDAAMNGFPSVKRITIWIENCSGFYKSWEKIISLKPKMIYPGHGKPFMPSDLQKYLSFVKHIKTLPLQ